MSTPHYFSPDTFALLQLLHREKSVDTYLANSDAFCSSIQEPFQDLFREAQKLPRSLKQKLITDEDYSS